MMMSIDYSLYFLLLMHYNIENNLLSDNRESYDTFVPYTCSTLISNKDLYNVNEIVDQCFFEHK